MSQHQKINYIEIPATDLTATKAFFSSTFNWSFIDYGDEYCSFSNAGIDGGFYKSDLVCSTNNGSVLVVLLSDNLEQTQSKIESSTGSVIKPIFTFPGGRRFHFTDPSGNEFAVWSDIQA